MALKTLGGTLLLAALTVLLPVAAGPVAAADPVTSLVEVRPDGKSGAFFLVCDGAFLFNRIDDPDPNRMVVELPGVRNGITEGRVPVGSDLVSGISLSPAPGGTEGTRIVFDLSRPCPATLRSEGDTLIVTFEPDSPASPQAQPLGSSLAAGIAGRAAPARVGPAGTSPRADYVIGSEDLLEISVFEQPDLNRTVRVSGDGTISVPLLGIIPVDGLTTKEAEGKLRDLLGEKYLTNPQVSVFVKEARSKKISVVGAVSKPGTVEMLGQRTLL